MYLAATYVHYLDKTSLHFFYKFVWRSHLTINCAKKKIECLNTDAFWLFELQNQVLGLDAILNKFEA